MHYFGAHSNGFQWWAGMWGIVAPQEIRRWGALSRSRSQIHVINFTTQKPNIINVINRRATKMYDQKICERNHFRNPDTELHKCAGWFFNCMKVQQTKEITLILRTKCAHWNVYASMLASFSETHSLLWRLDIYLFCLFSHSQKRVYCLKRNFSPRAPFRNTCMHFSWGWSCSGKRWKSPNWQKFCSWTRLSIGPAECMAQFCD